MDVEEVDVEEDDEDDDEGDDEEEVEFTTESNLSASFEDGWVLMIFTTWLSFWDSSTVVAGLGLAVAGLGLAVAGVPVGVDSD